jgi:RimJ/RimL family protein N-acetyltransferase
MVGDPGRPLVAKGATLGSGPDPVGRRRCIVCGDPIELDADRQLYLGHSSAADAAGIEALYQRLSRDDLHRRFFTGGSPPRQFFTRWAAIEEEGGFGLVAVLVTPGGERLVGEAGYALAPGAGADGELGVVVDPGYRGWLGPWLLDRLLAHAHERGVPNLQAILLVENRAMQALVAKRGYATLGHPDWSTVRVTMATAGPVPGWGGDRGRPRVLIETDRSRSVLEEPLQRAGFDIALCNGPCRSGKVCPVLRGERCPLVEGADVVVVDLPDDQVAAELLRSEQVIHPGVRLVAMSQPDRVEHPRLGPVEVVDRVRQLLAEGDDPDEAGPTG